MSIFDKFSLRPSCASHSMHRSKRKGLLEQILHAAPVPCNVCDERYYRFRPPVHPVEKPPHHAA